MSSTSFEAQLMASMKLVISSHEAAAPPTMVATAVVIARGSMEWVF